MVRIDFNKVNHTAFHSVKTTSNNPFAKSNFKGHSSPIIDTYVKEGSNKIKNELAPIKSIVNSAKNFVSNGISKVKSQVGKTMPNLDNVKSSTKSIVSNIAAAIVPKSIKVKMLAKKPVAELSNMLKNSLSLKG